MRGRTAKMACTLVLVCAVVAGCAQVTGGAAVPADDDGPRPVPAATLPDVLLDASTVSEIMGSDGMRVNDARARMFDAGSQFPDADCMAAWMPVEKSVYAGTEWTATIAQVLTDSALDHFVIQAVTVFATRHDAQRFFDATARRWTPCGRSEEHTSELQSRGHLVCRLLLEKKN